MEGFDEKIKINIQNIINLLRQNNALDWAQVFEKNLHDFNAEQDKKAVARLIINIYKGGIGSFADLILQKDMKMLVEENDQLAVLKHELFNACVNYLEASTLIGFRASAQPTLDLPDIV